MLGDQVYVKAKYKTIGEEPQALSNNSPSQFTILYSLSSRFYACSWPVFHVSQLELAIPNTILNWTHPSPPPVEVDGKPEFEISEILDSKIDHQCKTCKLLYLVWWSGYEGTDKETSWLLTTELSNVTELLDKYHSWYPDKPGPMASM